MHRYFFEISYNGTAFAGWQSQANAVGVQDVVEETLTKFFRKEIKIVGSGRTDTGVHCEQQFFHADFEKPLDTGDLSWKLNSFLPKAIAIHSIREVRQDAHARYSARQRSYQYRITFKKNPFLENLALHYFKPVNVRTMAEATALLAGEHDFQCFSKVKTDVNHFICDIKKASWKEKDGMLLFDITANRFLRGMVRAIVGTLLDVGTGKISVKDFRKILTSKDRRNAGANVAPYGLYLVKVKYPASVFI